MNTIMTIFTKRSIRLLLIAIAVGVTAGCNFGTTPDAPTSTPQQNLGVISGLVWQDQCSNNEDTDLLPSGCVIFDSAFVGNGVYDDGELGLDSFSITLGTGVCPADGLATAMTDVSGTFIFSELAPGEYCVTAHDSTSQNALWTYPKSGSGAGVGWITVTVGAAEIVRDINFGRDYLEIPPTAEPTEMPPSPVCTDAASFVRDVTIPDGTRFDPGESFTKTWRLRNEGTCTWNPDYAAVSVASFSLIGPTLMTLPTSVSPGSTIDISMEMQAPLIDGAYEGFWKLRNDSGGLFGIGDDGDGPFWVSIEVGAEPEPEITEWRGEYFDNKDLAGEPVLIRNDEEIDFDWGSGAPDEDVPSNNFSVLWTREVEFKHAIYRFTLEMDDGASLWVDDVLVIDEWVDGSVRERYVDLEMKKGKHKLEIAYYESRDQAKISFDWEELKDPTFESWKGTYWLNKTMDSKWALISDDEEIDFDWKDDSPHFSIPENIFSVQWKRTVDFEPGLYIFNAHADDGLRVFLDDALIIDEWHQSNGKELYSVEMNISGEHELTVAYYEQKGQAMVQFWWTLEGPENTPPEVVDDEYNAKKGLVLEIDAPGVLENDQDPDGDRLSALLEGGPSHGQVELSADGSFRYTPDEEFDGEDSFRYRASDGLETSAIATVTINVIAGNNPPIAKNDSYSISEGGYFDVSSPGILGNDWDPDGDELTATLVVDVTAGTLDLREDGSFSYAPNLGFTGEDMFTYQITDFNGESSTASVYIKVKPVEVEI
jgi:hypothetical protein